LDAQTSSDYRRALSAFPTGVVLITVADGEGPVGLVANSFTSLSLEPPLVLWCLGDRSDRGAYFREAERYSINILGAGAEDLARRYAQRGLHRIEAGDLAPGAEGVVVKGAASVLHCRTAERIHLADHLLIVGRVEAFDVLDPAGDGLTYFRSRFGRAAALE
jgi:3-hydroxy-9,10-secoandrosta-1,3,5(10)-triene-9,17-dione monooxygenase reductase component